MQRNRSLKAKPADPHPRCLFCRHLLAMHQRLSQERCLWSRNETVIIIRLLGVPVIGLKFGGFGQEIWLYWQGITVSGLTCHAKNDKGQLADQKDLQKEDARKPISK